MLNQALRQGPEEDSAAIANNEPGLVYGPSSPLRQIRLACVRIASSKATVLITGETGTGKEVFARLLHAHSTRADRAFVPVNCGAIPESLIESELFGYVRGAFTGATSPRRGRVALADGGTLFLDEIGELSLAMQVKLLRLLQEKTYEPVGSSTSVTADFRLVAATNRDLPRLVRQGRFRADLFYRLHVCPLHLPPLRERPQDVVPLFMHFWKRHGETRALADSVIRRLERYDWPGNVRELENLVERLSVCTPGATIEVDDLPVAFLGNDEGLVLEREGYEAGEAQQVSQEMWAPPEVHLPDDLPPPALTPPPARARTRVDIVTPTPPFGVNRTAEQPEEATAEAAGSAACDADDGEATRKHAAPVAHASSASLPITGLDATSPPTPANPATVAPSATAPSIALPGASPSTSDLSLPVDLPTLLRSLEDAYIRKALAQTNGNKKEAAMLLGLGRTTLVEKLRRRAGDASAT